MAVIKKTFHEWIRMYLIDTSDWDIENPIEVELCKNCNQPVEWIKSKSRNNIFYACFCSVPKITPESITENMVNKGLITIDYKTA